MMEALKEDAQDWYNRRLRYVLWVAVASWVVMGTEPGTKL